MGYLVKHAEEEFKVLGWPGDCEMQEMMCDNLLELLSVFEKQGHSGFSANYLINHLTRLMKYDPISPLTGEESEWEEAWEGVYQNKRCPDVFKDRKDGKAYWNEGRVFKDSEGCTYTNSESRVYINFPWVKPKEPEVVEVEE